MPLVLFDPANPLLARHLLSGTISQIIANPTAVTTIPDSTINSLKRKLEEKAGSSSMENDWEINGEEPQRDKRMRTTITPEQLEVLYQKYLWTPIQHARCLIISPMRSVSRKEWFKSGSRTPELVRGKANFGHWVHLKFIVAAHSVELSLKHRLLLLPTFVHVTGMKQRIQAMVWQYLI